MHQAHTTASVSASHNLDIGIKLVYAPLCSCSPNLKMLSMPRKYSVVRYVIKIIATYIVETVTRWYYIYICLYESTTASIWISNCLI